MVEAEVSNHVDVNKFISNVWRYNIVGKAIFPSMEEALRHFCSCEKDGSAYVQDIFDFKNGVLYNREAIKRMLMEHPLPERRLTYAELILIWDALDAMPKDTHIYCHGDTVFASELKEKISRMGSELE